MKRLLILLSLLLLSPPLLAMFAMSDAAALKRARELWGDVAMIGTARDIFASNWYKQVGYKSPGCYNEFTILGSGFNTWDVAFDDASTKPPVTIAGPFKGNLTITAEAFDNQGVTGFQYFVDGVGQPAVTFAPDPPQLKVQVNLTINTTTLNKGNHVLCARATDAAGNTGRSPNGWLFSVDQATGVGDASWVPNQATAGQPGISRIYFLQNGVWVENH
jgi:hypothetical protein